MAERPDLNDVGQVRGRLELSDRAMQRLQFRGDFPKPDLHFRSHPLWWWPRVEHWTAHRRRLSRRPFRQTLPAVDLVDASSIAHRLGVLTGKVEKWIADGRFIAPDYTWDHTVAWVWPTVDDWLRGRRRLTTGPTSRRAPSELTASIEQPAVEVPRSVSVQPVHPEPEPLTAIDRLIDELAALQAQVDPSEEEPEIDATRRQMQDLRGFVDGGSQ